MVIVTMMVNVCDDDCYLVMKVILVKEVMSCDVSPVAMFENDMIMIMVKGCDAMKVVTHHRWCGTDDALMLLTR